MDVLKSKKNQLSALLVLLLTGLTIYYLTRELSGREKQLEAALKVLDWHFLVLALLTMVLSLVLEALATRSLLSPVDRKNTTWGTLIRVPLLNQLGIGLTPFASGGQPAQLYALTRGKIEGSRALSVILMKFLVYQIVVVLFFIVGYVAADSFIYKNVDPTFATFIPFAIAIHAVVIIGLLLVMFWPKLSLKVVEWSGRAAQKFMSASRVKKLVDTAEDKVNNFHQESKRVARSAKSLLVATLWTALQLIAFYLVPYFVIRAFGYGSVNPWLILTMNIMIVMVISLFPIPGGVGGAELSFQLLFTPFVKNPATLVLVILIWRIITYYFCLFAGILAYVIPNKEQRLAKQQKGWQRMDDLASKSVLTTILNRLFAMEKSTDQRFQVRRFDSYGLEVLKVTLDQEDKVWTIEEHRRNKQYKFDDVDLVAIEIYDLLFDIQHTF